MGLVCLGVLTWSFSAMFFQPDHAKLNILIIWLMVIPVLVPEKILYQDADSRKLLKLMQDKQHSQ